MDIQVYGYGNQCTIQPVYNVKDVSLQALLVFDRQAVVRGLVISQRIVVQLEICRQRVPAKAVIEHVIVFLLEERYGAIVYD